MKKIHLTEEQFNKLMHNSINESLLKEFMQEGFNWDKFQYLIDNNEDMDEVIEYCEQYLEEMVGEGSSRCVFELDDNKILKVTLDKFNTSQNEKEWNNCKMLENNPLITKVYTHDKDFNWLVCERVLPLKLMDFEKILGIPYSERAVGKPQGEDYKQYNCNSNLPLVVHDDEGELKHLSYEGFVEWFADYEQEWEDLYSEEEREAYRIWLQHPWFQNLVDLFNYQIKDEFFDENMGIAIRNGEPMIVILDMGWNY